MLHYLSNNLILHGMTDIAKGLGLFFGPCIHKSKTVCEQYILDAILIQLTVPWVNKQNSWVTAMQQLFWPDLAMLEKAHKANNETSSKDMGWKINSLERKKKKENKRKIEVQIPPPE